MSFPTKEELWAWFTDSEEAVYFATADKQKEYFGFGIEAMTTTSQPVDLKQWLEQQTQPVFGGLPFDEQPINNSNLMQGYFVAPQVVYERQTQTIWGSELSAIAAKGINRVQARIINQQDDQDWQARVDSAIDLMRRDHTKKKVVLGRQRQLALDKKINEFKLLADLNEQQPHSYHFVIKHAGELFISATPERLVQVNGQAFATAGVAGTTRRGNTSLEDQQLADELLHDKKNLVEHAYVVSTIVERVGELAELQVPSGPSIMKNPQVQHLYTPISGQLKAQTNIIDLLLRLHPTPALGGKPLEWAMATIKDIELEPRGLFAAPIGILLPSGDGEFVVGIRSMLVREKEVRLFAGAGILADSNAAQEFNETGLKMMPMMNLLKG